MNVRYQITEESGDRARTNKGSAGHAVVQLGFILMV